MACEFVASAARISVRVSVLLDACSMNYGLAVSIRHNLTDPFEA